MALTALGVVGNAVGGSDLGALKSVASRRRFDVLSNNTVALRQDTASIVADRERKCEHNFPQNNVEQKRMLCAVYPHVLDVCR